MKGGSKASGFTIIETLIVMAVGGAMFVGVVLMIAGRQGISQFQQSINGVTQQLQQIIGEVSNGYYPTSNIKCSASGGPVAGKPNLTYGSGSIGTKSDCILVGKVIQFNQNTDPQQLIVYSMVGLRQTSAGQNVASLAEANPIAVAPGSAQYSGVPDAQVVSSLTNGLSLVYANYPFSSASASLAFAILASPAASVSAPSGSSGSQLINLYAVNNTSASVNPISSNVESINNYSNFVPATEFRICLASGTTNQSGLITIGGNGRQLAVNLSIKGNKTCS